MTFKWFLRLAIICLWIAVYYVTPNCNKGLLFYCSVAFFVLLLVLDYKPLKNITLYCILAVCAALAGLPILNSNALATLKDLESFQIVFYCFIACVILILWLYRFFKKKAIRKIESPVVLFRERRADAERIVRYLEKYSVIGINGDWGTGKSFLIEYLQKNELNDKFYFVNIHPLSCNTDDVSSIILNELEAALFKQGIFSRYAFGIKELFNAHKLLQVIKSFLHISNSTNDMIEGFSKELDKSDKPIVIVIEDLDRLIEEKSIRKIFSLAEHFASFSHNVKFMIEYNQNNLFHQFENLNRSYVEKYVPHVVNLTNLGLYQIIANLFSIYGNEYRNIKLEDFGFLEYGISLTSMFDGLNEQTQGIRLSIPNWQNVSIRKVADCLKDIDLALDDDNYYRERGTLNIVIMHYLLGNLCDDYFELFNEDVIDVASFYRVTLND